jgi:iron complex outermembrane receptor protein
MLYKYSIPQPPFVTNQVYANAADAVNTGVEVSLGGDVINHVLFQWTVSGNAALVRNRLTNLLGQFKGFNLAATNNNYGQAFGGSFQIDYVTQLQKGYPAGVFNLPQHAGFDSQGNELFVVYDQEGNATTSTTFTEADKVYIDPTPDFEWSLTNAFAYKNFDLSIYVRAVQGGKIFANTLLNLESKAYLPAVNVTEQGLNSNFAEKPNISTYWLQDASFVRVENITLGYTLKQLKAIRKLRFYVVGKNLLLLTKYRGLDPETNVEGTQRYIDQSYYPKTRSITLGLDLSF